MDEARHRAPGTMQPLPIPILPSLFVAGPPTKASAQGFAFEHLERSSAVKWELPPGTLPALVVGQRSGEKRMSGGSWSATPVSTSFSPQQSYWGALILPHQHLKPELLLQLLSHRGSGAAMTVPINVGKKQEKSLKDLLQGWDGEGGREGDTRGKRYENICICITDSLCYKAETNTPL